MVTYNAEVAAYDTAVAARLAQDVYWYDALFGTLSNVVVPNAPCPPTRPPVYGGVRI